MKAFGSDECVLVSCSFRYNVAGKEADFYLPDGVRERVCPTWGVWTTDQDLCVERVLVTEPEKYGPRIVYPSPAVEVRPLPLPYIYLSRASETVLTRCVFQTPDGTVHNGGQLYTKGTEFILTENEDCFRQTSHNRDTVGSVLLGLGIIGIIHGVQTLFKR